MRVSGFAAREENSIVRPIVMNELLMIQHTAKNFFFLLHSVTFELPFFDVNTCTYNDNFLYEVPFFQLLFKLIKLFCFVFFFLSVEGSIILLFASCLLHSGISP